MILTLTFNAALDRLIFIDELRPGTRMIPHKMIDAVGGKGFDASVALSSLGVDTLAMGFVGGQVGQQLVKLLDGYGVAHDLIWLEGETRLSHVIAETKANRHSHIIAGSLPVSAEGFEAFLRHYRQQAAAAQWIIAAGSLASGMPADCYQSIIDIAHQVGTPILVDVTGPPALTAVSARPTILKMNETELVATFGVPADSIEQVQAQAKIIREREKLPALVITCGKDGILAVTGDGAYFAVAPLQQAVNAAGAGDSASAALAWRRAAGDDWPETLRRTAAISAAAVLTEGTGEVCPSDVERLLPQTSVRAV